MEGFKGEEAGLLLWGSCGQRWASDPHPAGRYRPDTFGAVASKSNLFFFSDGVHVIDEMGSEEQSSKALAAP